jgi:hypothetical protein
VDTKIPAAPAAATSFQSTTSTLSSVSSSCNRVLSASCGFPQYMTGMGPGKLPRASSCSLQNILSELREAHDTNAPLALALVRRASDKLETADDCNNRPVGVLGSSMSISGLSVSLPDGEEKACANSAWCCWAAAAEFERA